MEISQMRMKIILLVVALLMFFPFTAHGVTRYVDMLPGGDCDGDYDPLSRQCDKGRYKSYDNVDEGLDASAAGDTLIIQPGVYNTAAYTSIAANVTIKGGTTDPNDTTIDLTSAGRWLNPNDDPNITIKYLTIQNSDASYCVFGLVNNSDNFTIEKCRFINCGRVISLDGGVGAKIRQCEFLGSTSISYYMYFKNAQADIYNCIFRASLTNPMRYIQTSLSSISNNLNIYNSYFSGCYKYAICAGRDADIINLKNCILLGNGLAFSDGFLSIKGSCAGVSVDYCLVLPTYNGSELDSQIIETNAVDNFPKIQSYSRQGIVTIGIDDNGNYDEAKWMADQVEAYGWHMYWAMYVVGSFDNNRKEAIVELINDGHEIASHSHSHCNLNDIKAFTLTHSTATMDIAVNRNGDSNTWTGTLQLSTGQSINLHDPDYDTVGELVSYLNSQSGYTCAIDAGSDDDVKTVCLADSNFSLAEGYCCLFDREKYLTVEITEAKTELEAIIQSLPGEGYFCPNCINYEVKTFVCPFNYSNNYVMDTAYSAGYTMVRSGHETLKSEIRDLTNLAVYASIPNGYRDISELDPNSKSRVNLKRVAGSLSFAAETGSIMNFFLHGIPENYDDLKLTELLKSDVQSFLSCLNDMRDQFLIIGSLCEASYYIHTNGICIAGDTDGSDQRWRITFADNFDGRLSANSPCIDSGLDLGLSYQYDFVGNSQYGNLGEAWDIGPYLYKDSSILDDDNSSTSNPPEAIEEEAGSGSGCFITTTRSYSPKIFFQ